MDSDTKRSRIREIIEQETRGEIYKTHKYSLETNDPSAVEYGEVNANIQWKRRGETKNIRDYVPLFELSKKVKGIQLFSYFLDGSRHVYKVYEMSFEKSGNRKAIYPVIAGQIGVGCCRRENKQMFKEKLRKEIVVAMPDIAQTSAKKQGFLVQIAHKLNESNEMERIGKSGWLFSTVLPYKSVKEEKDYNDKGTAQIQTRMMKNEQDMVAELVSEKKLNNANFLVKDGSLEYRPTAEMRTNERKYQEFKNKYDYVIGVSKRFNPESCLVLGDKPNPGYIADIPLYNRTAAAYFTDSEILGNIGFAVWYIRIRHQKYTRSVFDGIVKVEKILVTQEEVREGMDSDLIDLISAHIINERNPVSYGNDARWANHLYAVHLTEQYVKSHYLSTASFLQLFEGGR